MNSLAVGFGALKHNTRDGKLKKAPIHITETKLNASREGLTHFVKKNIMNNNANHFIWENSELTFLLWEMLRAPKSLNSEDVGEFTGSVEDQTLSETKQ